MTDSQRLQSLTDEIYRGMSTWKKVKYILSLPPGF